MTTETYAAALEAYDNGFMPIPLRRELGQRKKPALSTWRQYQAERPSRDVVEGWFDNFDGEQNLGIICGKVSGIVVVDLDGQIPDPKAWLKAHGYSTNTPIVSTGKGGAHVYYRHPGGTVPNGVKLKEVDGVTIDIRADGGYVVAPPSLHDTGALYEWANLGFDASYIEPFPQELAALLNRATEHGTIKVSDVLGHSVDDILAPAQKGQRNHAAARVAGYFLKVCNGDEGAAFGAVHLWNLQNDPPLPEQELRTTFASIARRHAVASVSLEADPEAEGDPVPVMGGKDWAEHVRNLPPREGAACTSVPGIEEVGGLVPRDLIILAGRPGMGKSTCAWNAVAEVCLQGPKLPTVIFSTEMTANDVARWMGSKLFEKDPKALTPDEWNSTLGLIARAPVTMCDAGAVTVDQIAEVVRSRPGTRLVIVDHIQRVNSGRPTGGDNRNLEVGRTAQVLKSLAKDTGCTVLALSQMNRASDQLGRPRLSSLRDSGEIEQEADAVMFLWTQADDITPALLDVEFYLAKNRHGALAQVKCTFDKPRRTFVQQSLKGELARIREQQAHKELLGQMERGEV